MNSELCRIINIINYIKNNIYYRELPDSNGHNLNWRFSALTIMLRSLNKYLINYTGNNKLYIEERENPIYNINILYILWDICYGYYINFI